MKIKKSSKKPTLDWIGGLKKFKDHYTSLELQKKGNEWREQCTQIKEDFSFATLSKVDN
jgi:hypothetical protein